MYGDEVHCLVLSCAHLCNKWGYVMNESCCSLNPGRLGWIKQRSKHQWVTATDPIVTKKWERVSRTGWIINSHAYQTYIIIKIGIKRKDWLFVAPTVDTYLTNTKLGGREMRHKCITENVNNYHRHELCERGKWVIFECALGIRQV